MPNSRLHTPQCSYFNGAGECDCGQLPLPNPERRGVPTRPLFSTQPGFCCICGAAIRLSSAPRLPSFHRPVCDRVCLDEYLWRECLSTMGKDYYVRVKPEATSGKEE